MIESAAILSAFIGAVAALELHVVEDASVILACPFPDGGGGAADAENLLWLVVGVLVIICTPLFRDCLIAADEVRKAAASTLPSSAAQPCIYSGIRRGAFTAHRKATLCCDSDAVRLPGDGPHHQCQSSRRAQAKICH